MIAYLKREFGDIDINYTGVDVSEKLLDEAKNRLPDIEFIRGDIIDGISIKESDIVLFFGVISFFDNVETVFENLFRLSSRNGGVYVFAPFNKYGYKVKYEYTHINEGERITDIEYTHSISEISDWLDKKGVEYFWHKFDISIDIAKSESSYPIRVWTEKMYNGERIQRDMIDRIEEQYLLEILM